MHDKAGVFLWHNGRWIDDGAALFSAGDRMRLGDGVYDTLLCVDGSPLYADRHFSRLLADCDVMGITIDMDFPSYFAVLNELLKRNKAGQGRFAVNTIISRGAGQRGLAPPESPCEAQMVIRLGSKVPERFVRPRGIIARSVRRNEGSPLSRIKSFNYGDNILALQEARQRGADEAVLLNNAGNVTCASAGNVFIVKGDVITTPPLHDGVLGGIARQILMERYAVCERSITEEDLLAADEIFLTNSIRGILFFQTLEGCVYCENTLGLDTEFHMRPPGPSMATTTTTSKTS